MNRLIYVGMDVHKDTYALCSFDSKQNYMFSETTVKAETSAVLSYIKNIEKKFIDDDVMVVCGYEAGPTGFSLCRELQKKTYRVSSWLLHPFQNHLMPRNARLIKSMLVNLLCI